MSLDFGRDRRSSQDSPQADLLARRGGAGRVGAIVAVGARRRRRGRASLTASGSIARVNIDGLIRSDHERVEALERLEKSIVAAVIVHINSPGGTTAGSEQLYDALTRLKAKKPMVVVVDGLAASGGYITALASDHIVAQQSVAGRLDRRAVPVPEFHRASENRRSQGRGSEILAAEGRARTALNRPVRRRAPRSTRW